MPKFNASLLGDVGFLLCGGGCKGIYQAGGIQAFLDMGLDYKAVYGSSVGTLNAMMLHQGKVQELHDLWMTIKNRDVYSLTPWSALGIFCKKASLYDSKPLYRLLDKVLDYEKMVSNPRDFWYSATDYSTWEPIIFECKQLGREDLLTTLFASASPPILFPFVPWKGQRLADSGVLNNYNVTKSIHDGMDTLVIFSFAIPSPKDPGNIIQNVEETLSISMYGYFNRELAAVDKVDELIRLMESHGVHLDGVRPIKRVIVIPYESANLGLMNFDMKGHDRETLYKAGYELTQKAIKDLIEGL